MSIDDVVNVQITATASTPTRAGFGVPLIVAYHNQYNDLVRSYTSLKGMAGDGFTVADPAYRMAQVISSQRPRPVRWKVGRRATPFEQVVDLTPASPSLGKVYAITANGTEVSYTSIFGDTLATVCTALALALNGNAGETDPDSIIATGGVSSASPQTLTGASLNGVVGIGTMDPPRRLEFVLSSHADWNATTITVTGTNRNGAVITELFVVPDGGNTTLIGAKLFRTVTSVAIPAQGGGGGTYTMGTIVGSADQDSIIAVGTSTASIQTLDDESELNGIVGLDEMDPPRPLFAVFSTHADWDETTMTITGVDKAGNTVTDTIAIPNGGGTTVNATDGTLFFRVTSVSVPAQTGTGGNFTLGAQNRFSADGASGTKIVVTTTSDGMMTTFEDMSSTLTLKDQTQDPGITDDLDAIREADADWYGVLLDSNSQEEVEATAAWAEAFRCLFGAQTSDSEVRDSAVTDDVASNLKADALARTTIWFHPDLGTDWLISGLMAQRFTANPGTDSWANKTVANVSVYTLSDTHQTNLKNKRCGYYVELAGIPMTFEGKVSAGEWVDIVRYIDSLQARIQERYIFLIANNEKISFTDEGISLIVAEVDAELVAGVSIGAIATDPPHTVTAPKALDISAINRQNRLLDPGIEFTARLTGAIHATNITGTLTS